MNYNEVMTALEECGSEQTKKVYISHGARTPLFGVSIKNLKPIAKKIKKNQKLANELYASGNYDAMYLAGMIAEPETMTEADFERWIDGAYCHMAGDYIVAVTLAESPLADGIADKWIASGDELKMSAGWSAYSWLLGVRKDETFNIERLRQLLDTVRNSIHTAPNRTCYAMNTFVISVGVSYLPLHAEALAVAQAIGKVTVYMGKTSCKVPNAAEYITKTAAQDRIGFKRRNVRC